MGGSSWQRRMAAAQADYDATLGEMRAQLQRAQAAAAEAEGVTSELRTARRAQESAEAQVRVCESARAGRPNERTE